MNYLYKIERNDKKEKNVRSIISVLPPGIIRAIDNGRAFVAGGLLRSVWLENTHKGDCDIFFLKKAYFNIAQKELLKFGAKVIIKDNNKNFLKYRLDSSEIDLVYNGQSIINTLEEFDLIVSKIAYTQKHFLFHRNFPVDIKQKQITYTGSLWPEGSLYNVLSLRKQGFKIDGDNFKRILTDLEKIKK